MASKYYIKLWFDILDDPKMGRLSDRLFKRTIQLFLLAGEFQEDGLLPPLDEMAWRLRLEEEELVADLETLADFDLITIGRYEPVTNELRNVTYRVTNFNKWQNAVDATERMRRFRERKMKEVPTPWRNGYEPVTNRNQEEKRKEKKRKEKKRREPPAVGTGAAGLYICNLFGYDYDTLDSRTKKVIDKWVEMYGEYKVCDMAQCLGEEYEPKLSFREALKMMDEGLLEWEVGKFPATREMDY